MAEIQSVLVCTVRIPLDRVTSFSSRTVYHRDYCLVKVRSKDGVDGIGFCYVGSAAGNIGPAAVEQLLAPRLVGQESHRIEGLWDDMYREALLHGRVGAVMRALSALDIALWDLNSRAANLPLHQFLGCWTTESVPAYASGGYYLDGKTPKELGAELEAYVNAGFDAVKIKVGRLSPKEEEERVRAARAAIGADVRLMLDANNAWSDVPTAIRYVERWAKYDPYWIEEPFGPDDIESHVALAQRTRIPVATGELEAGRWRFKELLDRRAATVLQVDACVCGGITEYRRIAHLASAYGVTLCPHWFHDVHAQLVASLPNSRYVEFFPDDQVLNFRRLIDRQLVHRNGRLILPSTPGLGFAFDDKAVKKYAQGNWTTIRNRSS